MPVEDDQNKSHIFNDYFSSVFTMEKLERLPILKSKRKREIDKNILNNVLITEEFVYNKT